MTTDEKGDRLVLVIDSSFVIRHSSFRRRAFTVIELLIVMSIIIVLAGLILATSGYVQKKGARSRAEAEIAAMSAALESYKADNGIYPTNADTDALKRKLGNHSVSDLRKCEQISLHATRRRPRRKPNDSERR